MSSPGRYSAAAGPTLLQQTADFRQCLAKGVQEPSTNEVHKMRQSCQARGLGKSSARADQPRKKQVEPRKSPLQSRSNSSRLRPSASSSCICIEAMTSQAIQARLIQLRSTLPSFTSSQLNASLQKGPVQWRPPSPSPGQGNQNRISNSSLASSMAEAVALGLELARRLQKSDEDSSRMDLETQLLAAESKNASLQQEVRNLHVQVAGLHLDKASSSNEAHGSDLKGNELLQKMYSELLRYDQTCQALEEDVNRTYAEFLNHQLCQSSPPMAPRGPPPTLERTSSMPDMSINPKSSPLALSQEPFCGNHSPGYEVSARSRGDAENFNGYARSLSVHSAPSPSACSQVRLASTEASPELIAQREVSSYSVQVPVRQISARTNNSQSYIGLPATSRSIHSPMRQTSISRVPVTVVRQISNVAATPQTPQETTRSVCPLTPQTYASPDACQFQKALVATTSKPVGTRHVVTRTTSQPSWVWSSSGHCE
eukprot:TRINITY_DN13161_c0_g1_i5.p1 TRINITY_DN13161_c0_g1~~TRINITY_DN13161_c0_g1_i5.p1  ORF type:complete len:485 (+),score=49.62 TRINITY_DN13161_c0_g1_i5:133-1587(+)